MTAPTQTIPAASVRLRNAIERLQLIHPDDLPADQALIERMDALAAELRALYRLIAEGW